MFCRIKKDIKKTIFFVKFICEVIHELVTKTQYKKRYGEKLDKNRFPTVVAIVRPTNRYAEIAMARDIMTNWLQSEYPDIEFGWEIKFTESQKAIADMVYLFGFSEQDKCIAMAMKMKWG